MTNPPIKQLPPAMSPSAFAHRLLAARARLGLSQAKLAKQLGVHSRTISDWERGQEPASPVLVELALEALLARLPHDERVRQRLEEDIRPGVVGERQIRRQLRARKAAATRLLKKLSPGVNE